MLNCVSDNVADTPNQTPPFELSTVPTSFAFVELLFAFSLLLVSALVISSHLFYLFLSTFSPFFSTVMERIAGIHSNMFVHVVCVCVCL